MDDRLVDRTSAVLAKVLDGASARQRVLADNIANVGTPNYIRKEVRFEAQLHEAMTRAPQDPADDVENIDNVPLDITADKRTPPDAHGNNVDIEREMVDMAKNSLQYETATQLLSMEYRELRSAIHEGRQ